jgi:hypothetical protein
VLKLDSILFCDRCEAASARTERGWRAYLVIGSRGARSLAVVCPTCAEASYGEDEAESEHDD